MQIQTLISQNRLDEAINLLLANAPNHLQSDVLSQSARYNQLKQSKTLGLISYETGEITQNQITAALLELADKISLSTAPTPAPTPAQPTQTQPVVNPLVQFNSLYKDRIHADLDGLNYDESNIRRYAQRLGEIFLNPALFNAFLQPLNDPAYNDVNATKADKREILKGILETFVKKEDILRTRLTAQVEKQNAEVEFVELLNNFFKNPTPKGWELVYQSVGQRFADRSLFMQGVSDAWDVWNTKISQLDYMDIAFDIADQNSQVRRDLGVFLATNLQIKNFNY